MVCENHTHSAGHGFKLQRMVCPTGFSSPAQRRSETAFAAGDLTHRMIDRCVPEQY